MTAETETFTAVSGVTKISPPVFLAASHFLAAISFSCCVATYAVTGAVFASLLAALLLLVLRMPLALGLSVS